MRRHEDNADLSVKTIARTGDPKMATATEYLRLFMTIYALNISTN